VQPCTSSRTVRPAAGSMRGKRLESLMGLS
jgi:hypothetical protein